MAGAIDGKTKLMGILGQDIEYTLSPVIHNYSAQVLGVNAVYLPLSLPREKLRDFLDLAWVIGASGFNVTKPHKAAVAQLIPGCRSKSINTLYRGQDYWQATSTDAEGFVRGLSRLNCQLIEFADVVFLGSGGVVAAILEYMSYLSVNSQPAWSPNVYILRRSGERDELLRSLWGRDGSFQISDLSADSLRGVINKSPNALIIQATSAPQHGVDLDDLCPALSAFSGVVCDLIYRNPSRLYHLAVSRGLKAQDGLPMLIEQARLSQELWWSSSASYDELAELLGEDLEL